MNKTPARRRKAGVSQKVRGTKERPRLAVYRSNQQVAAQLIDDRRGVTLVAVSEKELKGKPKGPKTARAFEAGRLLAVKALKKKITKVVFDRGAYSYGGRVKAVAEGARKGGLKF